MDINKVSFDGEKVSIEASGTNASGVKYSISFGREDPPRDAFRQALADLTPSFLNEMELSQELRSRTKVKGIIMKYYGDHIGVQIKATRTLTHNSRPANETTPLKKSSRSDQIGDKQLDEATVTRVNKLCAEAEVYLKHRIFGTNDEPGLFDQVDATNGQADEVEQEETETEEPELVEA